MTRLQPNEKARHASMMNDPKMWPAGPLLCLARRTRGDLECGLLFAGGVPGETARPPRTTVFVANRFLVSCVADLVASPREEFASAEEAVEAGWEVD